MDNYTKLKKLIENDDTLIVPDAYDGISAKIIEMVGFEAVQCSGYSFSLSKGYIQESYISLEENIGITKNIVDAVSIPVFADGEDGYGSGDIFCHNMKKFIATGIGGINIEDQNLWNPYIDEKLLPVSESISKIELIKAVCSEQAVPQLFINARTDAVNVSENRQKGLSEAIDRANRYYEAGADLCFVTGVKTKDEIKLLNTEINGPLSIAAGLPYNIDKFDINDCREIGVARVSLPSVMIFASIKSQVGLLESIKEEGGFENIKDTLLDWKMLNSLL